VEDFPLGDGFWVGSLPNGIRSDLVFDASAPAAKEYNRFDVFSGLHCFAPATNQILQNCSLLQKQSKIPSVKVKFSRISTEKWDEQVF
jgi:hypothetical protein